MMYKLAHPNRPFHLAVEYYLVLFENKYTPLLYYKKITFPASIPNHGYFIVNNGYFSVYV